MENNLVSIITPSYKSKKYIQATIESVKAQTYKNWEMIIVDDCSTDGSVEYIEELVEGEKRIKLIALKSNVGAAEARNNALSIVNGRFVAFLDSDDMWDVNKLKIQVEFMLKNKCEFSYTAYRVCDDSGSNIHGEINIKSLNQAYPHPKNFKNSQSKTIM